MRTKTKYQIQIVVALALILGSAVWSFAQSLYGVEFWRDLSKREKELEGQPDYHDFLAFADIDLTYAGKNPDWYVDMLSQGLMEQEAERDGPQEEERFEKEKRVYDQWHSEQIERGAKQAAENADIAREASTLTGTIPEFRMQLVAALKTTAGSDYPFLGGRSQEQFTQIFCNDAALHYVSVATMTGADGKASIYNYSNCVPWSALFSGQITLTQDPYSKYSTFQLAIKTASKDISYSVTQEGQPDQDGTGDSASINLGTDDSAARKVVMLLRRAAGITNAPAVPSGTSPQDNNLDKDVVLQHPVMPAPTNTETIEVTK